jgi:16S rRNA processing protein RimM
MLDKKDYLPIGVFTRTHGVQGALVLRLQGIEAEDLPEMEWVFVEIDGLPVPFFIEEIREMHQDRIILSFDTITSESRSRLLVGCRLFIKGETVSEDSSIFVGTEINGYSVADELTGEIGIATELIAINENPILRVQGKKEFLIPFHPDIILEISKKRKSITVKLPEGLVDL